MKPRIILSDQDLELRVHQIVNATEEQKISFASAVEQMLRERYKGPNQFEDLIRAATKFFVQGHQQLLRAMKHVTLNMPEPRQGCLFDIPNLIFVESEDGGAFISKDVATLGEVREWDRYALQHHSVQRMRFERFTKEIEIVSDLDNSVPWKDAFEIMQNRSKQITKAAS